MTNKSKNIKKYTETKQIFAWFPARICGEWHWFTYYNKNYYYDEGKLVSKTKSIGKFL